MIRSLALCAVAALLPVAAHATPPARVAEFPLMDQNAHLHRFSLPRKRISVLVASDHQDSSEIAGWIEPLYRRYGTRIDIAGIADLPAIPPLFDGLFRREFKKQSGYPVILIGAERSRNVWVMLASRRTCSCWRRTAPWPSKSGNGG